MNIKMVQANSYSNVGLHSMPCFVFPNVELQSAHADLKENCLAIASINDGLDVYSLPNMHLLKSYSHGNTNDMIFKVAFIANSQLVSGEKGGCA